MDDVRRSCFLLSSQKQTTCALCFASVPSHLFVMLSSEMARPCADNVDGTYKLSDTMRILQQRQEELVVAMEELVQQILLGCVSPQVNLGYLDRL